MKFKTYNELYEAIDSVGGNFEEKDHGEAPVSYADAVRRMNKKRKDVNKALEDHKNEYKDAFDNTEESKNSHKPMRRKETKKMGLSESLFEDVDEFNFTLALFKEGQKTRVAHLRDEDEVREFIKKHSSKYNAIEVYDELGHYRKDLSFITSKSLTEDWDIVLDNGQAVSALSGYELIPVENLFAPFKESLHLRERNNGTWAQVRIKGATNDGYNYCGNSGRSWVRKESDHIDTWPSEEAAIEDGKKNYSRNFKYGRDWDVVNLSVEESLTEDTIKQNGKWMNKGKEGAHGKFKTKKAADAQRKAMFVNGYNESLNEEYSQNLKNEIHSEILNTLAKYSPKGDSITDEVDVYVRETSDNNLSVTIRFIDPNDGVDLFSHISDVLDNYDPEHSLTQGARRGTYSALLKPAIKESLNKSLFEDLSNVYKVTYKYSDNIFSSVMIRANDEKEAREKFNKRFKEVDDKDIAGIKKMSDDDVAEMTKRGMKLLEDVEINPDLKGVETTPNPPEAGSDNYVANTLNQLIVGEWDTIKDYNDFIATLETMNMSTDILNVVKDIVNEEHVHIGQLQQALKTVSPNAVSITDGEQEGSKQLETQVEVGDPTVDGEMPTEHELEADTL